jgi:hypothetical protein
VVVELQATVVRNLNPERGGKMQDTVLDNLTFEEMQALSGGTSQFYCWGGGVMTVLGFASMNAMAATAGLFFIYNYF